MDPTTEGLETDESGEDSGKSVLIPTSMFPDAKPGDTVTMKIGAVFGEEMEAMPSKAAATKPTMPMSPSIEDDMRAEMMNPTPWPMANTPSEILASYPKVKTFSKEKLLKFIFVQRLMERDGVGSTTTIRKVFSDSADFNDKNDTELLEIMVAKYMGSMNPILHPVFETIVSNVKGYNSRDLKAAISYMEFQLVDSGDRSH
jgi:hypothetical protein